jgi:hypothetical protein
LKKNSKRNILTKHVLSLVWDERGFSIILD